MPFALELLVDPTTTSTVQTAVSSLHLKHPASHWRDGSLRPHLSLLVADFIDRDKITIACQSAPVAEFDSVQLGPTAEFLVPNYVLYLQVSQDPWLRTLQRRIYWTLFGSAQGIWHHYAPAVWVPHVTLWQGGPSCPETRYAIDGHCPILSVRFTEWVLVEFNAEDRQELVHIPLPNLSQGARTEHDAAWECFAEDMVRGEYFDAHEAIESLWRLAHDPRSQSAIWVAAAFVHWSRGTLLGAQKMFDKLLRDEAHRPDPLLPLILEWTRAINQRLPCPGIAPTDRDALVQWARYRA